MQRHAQGLVVDGGDGCLAQVLPRAEDPEEILMQEGRLQEGGARQQRDERGAQPVGRAARRIAASAHAQLRLVEEGDERMQDEGPTVLQHVERQLKKRARKKGGAHGAQQRDTHGGAAGACTAAEAGGSTACRALLFPAQGALHLPAEGALKSLRDDTSEVLAGQRRQAALLMWGCVAARHGRAHPPKCDARPQISGVKGRLRGCAQLRALPCCTQARLLQAAISRAWRQQGLARGASCRSHLTPPPPAPRAQHPRRGQRKEEHHERACARQRCISELLRDTTAARGEPLHRQ